MMDDSELEELTRREREILHLAREGLSNAEIGERLGLTHNTVRYHLKHLHAKLLTDGQRTALSSNGRRWGWLPAAFTGWLAPVGAVAAVAVVSVGGYLAVRAAHETHGATPPAAVAATATPAATPTVSPWGPYPIPQSTIDSLRAYRDQVLANPPPIDPDLLERMLSDQLDDVARGPVSQSQRDILADGYVTLDEYTAAETAWRDCMVSQGFTVDPFHINGLGAYAPTASGPDKSRLDSGSVDCSARYTGTLELAWAGVIAPIEAKVSEVQGSAYLACYYGAGGHNLPTSESDADGKETQEQASARCRQEIQAATDTGPQWLGG